jgi:hypothetical protein
MVRLTTELPSIKDPKGTDVMLSSPPMESRTTALVPTTVNEIDKPIRGWC